MRCRLYLPGSADARVLDRILDDNRHGDVSLDKDRIVVCTGDDGVPAGALVWRPVAFVHEFHVPHSLGQRTVASALLHDAIHLDIARRHLVRQAAFMIDKDNLAMLRYARDVLHATEQDGIIFLLDLTNLTNLKAPGDENGNESLRRAGQRTAGG